MTESPVPLLFRRAAVIVLMLLFSSVLLVSGLIVLVDPDQIFHRSQSWLPKHRFRNDPWLQNAGLINSYLADPASPFDAVMTGSSVSQNFQLVRLAGHGGHGQVMKLALSGASPMAQKAVLVRALSTGRVKHVYGEILSTQYAIADDTGSRRPVSAGIGGKSDNEQSYITGDFGGDRAYLYNASRIDDYRYVFNLHSLLATIALLFGYDGEYVFPMDRVGNWIDACMQDAQCARGSFLAPGAIDPLLVLYKSPGFDYRQLLSIYNADVYSLLNEALLDTVLLHCGSGMGFDLYFPPVSMMAYTGLNPVDFSYHFFMPRFVIEKTGHCKNVRVFAFSDDAMMIGNLGNYSDFVHFMPWVGEKIIASFISGENVVNNENIENYERKMLSAINGYSPYAIPPR